MAYTRGFAAQPPTTWLDSTMAEMRDHQQVIAACFNQLEEAAGQVVPPQLLDLLRSNQDRISSHLDALEGRCSPSSGAAGPWPGGT